MSHCERGGGNVNQSGVVKTEGAKLTAVSFVRSLTDEGRRYLRSSFSAIASLSGAQVCFPAIIPVSTRSPIHPSLQITQQQHALFGSNANIMVIHAGLECVCLSAHPNLDMVSIGPTHQ